MRRSTHWPTRWPKPTTTSRPSRLLVVVDQRWDRAPADVVPVRIDPELREAIEARSDAEHTTTSEIIREGPYADFSTLHSLKFARNRQI